MKMPVVNVVFYFLIMSILFVLMGQLGNWFTNITPNIGPWTGMSIAAGIYTLMMLVIYLVFRLDFMQIDNYKAGSTPNSSRAEYQTLKTYNSPDSLMQITPYKKYGCGMFPGQEECKQFEGTADASCFSCRHNPFHHKHHQNLGRPLTFEYSPDTLPNWKSGRCGVNSQQSLGFGGKSPCAGKDRPSVL